MRAGADSLEDARPATVDRAVVETALGRGRLDGELTRTAKQLLMFADIVADGAWGIPHRGVR